MEAYLPLSLSRHIMPTKGVPPAPPLPDWAVQDVDVADSSLGPLNESPHNVAQGIAVLVSAVSSLLQCFWFHTDVPAQTVLLHSRSSPELKKGTLGSLTTVCKASFDLGLHATLDLALKEGATTYYLIAIELRALTRCGWNQNIAAQQCCVPGSTQQSPYQ